jgi:hypothetical protein
MSNQFKKQTNERKPFTPRAAIPQVDPEAPKPMPAAPVAPAQPVVAPEPVEPALQAPTAEPVGTVASTERQIYLTPVDTNEQATNRGFVMYPSRHTQVVRDLSYIEGRRPWLIIDDALEEYVTRHYGKQYRRK